MSGTGSIRIADMPVLTGVNDATSFVAERAGSGRFNAPDLKSYVLGAEQSARIAGDTFTPPGAGGTPMPVVDRLEQSVLVTDYGAVGDGVHDDTAAIQAAINYVQTFSTGRAGMVVIPPGIYRITASLWITSTGVNLVGQGRLVSIIQAPSGSAFDWLKVYSSGGGISYISVRGIGFVPLGPQAAGSRGIYQGGIAAVVTYTDISVSNAYIGFRVEAGASGSVCRWTDFYIDQCSGAGFWVGNSGTVVTGFSAREGDIAQCGSGIVLQNCSGVYLNTLSIILCTEGISVAPQNGDSVRFVFCDQVQGDSSTDAGWTFSTTGTGEISNFICNNCWACGAQQNGIVVNVGAAIDGFTWADGHVRSNGEHGILLSAGTNLAVSGSNVFHNNYTNSAGVNGITVGAGVSGFRIIGNTCGAGGFDRQSGVTCYQKYGIVVSAGASDHYVIMGNVCSGNTVGGTADNGTGTNKSVSGNVV